MTNTIHINGTKYEVEGNNITVTNDCIIVDGKKIATGLSGITEVKREGPAANIECHNLTVKGDVSGDIDAHNVTCGNVGGHIDAHNVSARR